MQPNYFQTHIFLQLKEHSCVIQNHAEFKETRHFVFHFVICVFHFLFYFSVYIQCFSFCVLHFLLVSVERTKPDKASHSFCTKAALPAADYQKKKNVSNCYHDGRDHDDDDDDGHDDDDH